MLDVAIAAQGTAEVRGFIQAVQIPLQGLVIVIACYLAIYSDKRDRIMLAWFIAGLLATLLLRFLNLGLDPTNAWHLYLIEMILPTTTSACFLVSLILWWRNKYNSGDLDVPRDR